MLSFDVAVIGAGAAGLFCAGIAGQLGLKVLLLDHSEKVAEKIRISGGGRCNFTNRDLDAAAPHRHFFGENPQFCRSALSRYTAQDFIDLVRRHSIPFHEKHRGQLFGDRSAEDFIAMLLRECGAGQVVRWQPCVVHRLRWIDGADTAADSRHYEIDSDQGTLRAGKLVIATGGLSIPKMGASDFGYHVARQFDLRVVEPRPALVPLTFDGAAWQPFSSLAGLALPVEIETGTGKSRTSFAEDLLFTHHGLSGPAVLQISSYWRPGTPIRVNLTPHLQIREALRQAKASSRKLIANALSELVPSRLAAAWVQRDAGWQQAINEASDRSLDALAQGLRQWELVPSGTQGYRKAEVTAGGVDSRDLSSQTMESRQPGLYFIGEVVDVTGWLGGYNFQWAWSSAFACAQGLAASTRQAQS